MKHPHLGLATAIALLATNSQASNPLSLEEVVVTAQKREQSLQDVPISVSALSADLIEQTGAVTLSDVARLTPGLDISDTQAEDSGITLRGIGSNDFGYSSDESIPVYLDGVYLGSGSALVSDLMDIAQVEVLKGPQGSLFGRNAVGGAVSIHTTKPSEELEGKLSLDLGNYQLRHVKGLVNAPLIDDSLYIRAAFSKRNRDGWQQNTATGKRDGFAQDRWSARVKLLWYINDNIELELSNDWMQEDDHTGYYNVRHSDFAPLLSAATLDVDGTQANNGDAFLGLDPNTGLPNLNGPAGEGIDYGLQRKIRGNSAKLQWQINDNLSFSSISSYRELRSNIAEDNDGSEFSLLNIRSQLSNEEYSQEFRLSGLTDSLDWFIGLSAYRSDVDGQVEDSFGALITGQAFTEIARVKAKTESYALFGDVIWSVNEALNITLGARYSYDAKGQNINNPQDFGLLFAGKGQFLGADGLPDESLASSHKNWSNISPRLVLDYSLEDNVLVYAGISQGYKSGGFNSFPTVDVSTPTLIPGTAIPAVPYGSTDAFDEEQITNYEAGIKATLLDQQLRVNASVYYYDFKDLQFLVGDGVVIRAANAGKATGKGLDIESTYLLSEGLSLSLNLGWLNAEYGEDVRNSHGSLIVAKGDELSLAPELSANLSLDYAIDISDLGELRFHINYSHTGERSHDTDVRNPIYREKSSTLVNARLGFNSADGLWQLALWGRNLTDKATIESYGGVTDNFGIVSVKRNEPRTYGLNLQFNF